MLLYLIACFSSVSDTGKIIQDSASIEPEAPTSWSVQVQWRSVEEGYATGSALADIDGDLDLDLIVSEGNDMTPGYIRIYQNEGGRLEETASWVSNSPFYYGHLAVGDLNGDGWQDVVVSVFLGEEGFSSPGGLHVFLNQEGILSAEPDVVLHGFYSFSLALGDLENDGDLDIAVAAGESYYHDPEHSFIFCNDGESNFSSCWSTEKTGYRFDVAWADMNEDGWLDLLFANQEAGHEIYLNRPNEGFASTPSWQSAAEGCEGNTLDWGDIDRDGYLDLVVSDNDQQGGLGRIRAWCGPQWEQCWTSSDPAQMQSALALRDLDFDGDLDLVASAWWGNVRIYENRNGFLQTFPSAESDADDIVAEAFAWGALQGTTHSFSGQGLFVVPDRAHVLWVDGGLSIDGYVLGDNFQGVYMEQGSQNIILTDWDPQQGNWMFSTVP